METKTVYKLFKLRANGTLGPLFINARMVVPMGEWIEAEDHPTKGFAHRPGWHAAFAPYAPHLSEAPKSGPKRVWAECEAIDTTTYARPRSQGGAWVLANKLRVKRVLTSAEVEALRA